METLNLGILAHVDAGKTTLTERLLFAAGAIDSIGSVDKGTTQTDSLALERQRGITIKSGVASFVIDGVTVNLIDTPGHPDFIAEVDRALSVLDGAVLVISAVEGVQAQTVILMRALVRLSVPTLIFVNKIDRRGANVKRVIQSIAERLTPSIIPMGSGRNIGTRGADFVPLTSDDAGFLDAVALVTSGHDDDWLAALLDERLATSYDDLYPRLTDQVGNALIYPLFIGSATTGAGVGDLMSGITSLLPIAKGDLNSPASGIVFKIERGASGDRIAYVRMFSGVLHVRDRLGLGPNRAGKVSAIKIFEGGVAVGQECAIAGQIALLWGLKDVRIGDAFGQFSNSMLSHGEFAPPTLETVVVPIDPAQKAALRTALSQLAEQDPLISLRQDDLRQELLLSLYGEVQKEVIEQTLSVDFGINVAFRETTTFCIERLVGTGAAFERLGRPPNPFLATIAVRVEPAAINRGIVFRLEVDVGSVPLYVYKTVDAFRDSMEEYIRSTLQQGLLGWQVTDCLVTMTDCGYSPPGSTSGDFRKLAPLVVMTALKQAGTVVCEPVLCFHLEGPADALSPVLSLLARLRAAFQSPTASGSWFGLDGQISADESHRLQHYLPGITHGEGVLEMAFDRYAPIVGVAPTRKRSDHNPLNRNEYLRHILGRV